MSTRQMIAFLFFLSFSLVLMPFYKASYGLTIEASLENAILNGNWKKVSETLEKDEKKADDPVARLIMAHACLATNRNNESMLLFLSGKEEKDYKLWNEWTESFLQKNPKNPVALYLSADAKARQGKSKEALDGFTQALKIKEDFALAYNARGVVRVLTNDWDNAQVDFYLSTKIAPDLADAYTNLGTLGVFRETSLDLEEGALEAFNQALRINPEFALAYNGLGCIYFGSGRFEEAAKNFSKASELCPILVTAEINQGFASGYASKLIALANMEKKPGTTFEVINQQYPTLIKEEQQQLLKMFPSQKDQEFWKKMDALPRILQSDEKTQALINEYGPLKVRMGAFLKMQEYKSQITEANQKVQTLHDTLSSYDKKIWNTRLAEFVTSLGFSAWGTAGNLKQVPEKGWDHFALKAEQSADKAFISSATNHTLKTVVDAIPLGLNPIALTGSIGSSGFKIARSVLEDKRDATLVNFERFSTQVFDLGAQHRLIEKNLYKVTGAFSDKARINSPSQISGYYTSTDRPITEIGALASMVDKTITKPSDGSLRRALVVGQDTLRTNLQQQELYKHGFETKVISPEIDVQSEARKWGANVIVGIKGATNEDYKKVSPPFTPLDHNFAGIGKESDIGKKFSPIFPPDKGGGAAGIPQMSQPLIKQDWNWGKPYVPTYPKGSPGGISTEEIAKAFVDKGHWPVLTSFGLFYNVTNSNTK